MACQTGFYKQGAGYFPCSKCPVNTTTIEQASDEYADCLCESGSEPLSVNTSICAACPQGKYKDKPGLPQTCVSCPVNTITLGLGARMISDCVCIPGRYSVRNDLNVAFCDLCPVNPFKMFPGNANCTSCVANSFAPKGSNTSTNCICTASKAMTACQCLPGFSGPNAGPCAPCLAGEYKTINGSSACLQCTSNAISPAASRKVTDCLCNSGYVGVPGGPCSMCPQDTYANNGFCVACAANSQSESASAAITSCKCTAGYGGPAGGPCTPCSVGFYKSNTDNQCVKCPDNTQTISAAAKSVSECQSIAGFKNTEVKATWVKQGASAGMV